MSASSLNKLLNSNQWVDHTHRVIGSAKGILEAAINMETGMQATTLPERGIFESPTTQGKNTFSKRLLLCRKRSMTTLLKVELLGDIRDVINEWITNITTPQIELRRAIGNGKSHARY